MQVRVARPVPDRLSGLISWLGASERSRGWRGYRNAVVAVALTVVVRILLEVLFAERAPTYLVFLAPVFLAALSGGVVPGLVATLLGWAIAHFFFVDPAYSFKTSSQDWVIAGVFITEGTAISLIGGRLRETVTRALEREQKLAASEARLLMAQRAARIATYEWNPATKRMTWSDNAEEIMGIAPGTFAGTFEDSMSIVLPEDRPLVEASAEQLMRNGSNEAEYRVLGSDGQTRWMHATGTVIRAESGAIDRVVGVMMDVSERRRASAHSEFLADATAQLARSFDYRTNVAGLAAAAVPRFADMAAVVLVDRGEFPGEVVALQHRDPASIGLLKELQTILAGMPEQAGLLAQAIRSGTPLYMSSISEEQLARMALSEAHHRALSSLRLSSAICIPLTARGSTFGGLIFGQESGRTFDSEDFALATELGRRAAIAVENALLLEQSFEREGEASRANEALQLIADAGVELNASLELSETLESLARLVVPRFADACSIAIDQGGKLERAALAAINSELYDVLDSLPSGPGPDPEGFEQVAQVLRSNRPVFLPELPPDALDRLARDRRHGLALRSLAPRSLIFMPLTARAQTLGVMTFLRVGESPRFDRDDLSLAGQIARRTAISADNARLYSEARRANEAKDEFLGMMSHELRTPITVIHGGARVLRSRSGHLDEETREGLLDDIERESERLSRMLENLLALARAELDREVVLEPVLLQRLLPRLLSAMGASSGREFRLEGGAGLPAVAAEPGYIEHIIRNLVGNAVKYSPPDAPIEVAIGSGEGAACVRVLDRGFGIAGDESSRIFERFYRSDRTSRLAGGAGLGLAVCKRLVEAMSGEIWALPREGVGLEVGFSLPTYQEENSEK